MRSVYAVVRHRGGVEAIELEITSGIRDAELEMAVLRLEDLGLIERCFGDPAGACDPFPVCLLHRGAGEYSFTYVVQAAKEAPQKWSQLYMKVLTKLVSGGEVRLRVGIEATLKKGGADQRLAETKAALRELGLERRR